MKIVNLDAYTTNPGDLSWNFLNEFSGDVHIYDRTAPADVISRAKGAEILIVNKTVLTAEVIDALSPQLKFIALQSTGYNVVDMASVHKNNIVVSNIPKYSTAAVAQLVFAFILHFSNRVSLHNDSVHAGDWCRCPDFCYLKSPVFELSGKTLGIIGFGSIGAEVAKIAASFGMNIIANTRTVPADSKFKDIKFTELDYLLSNSDIITCHCPLTDKTRNMINAENIAKMKKSAYFINTSRGDVVNETALACALNAGQLAGAALDVLQTEPADCSNPLLTAKNCIITPHIAWAALETRRRLLDVLKSNIEAYLSGAPQNVVS
ncbi:MAG: D-2-hydroxyacid dehydrogenase [Clostridiales bacterium]|nr:D-2-hydroxyacid dehydrogenase [Clostridiales bacterium]